MRIECHIAYIIYWNEINGLVGLLAAKEILKNLGANAMSATLVINQANLGTIAPEAIVDYCGCIVHEWVIFPWEGKEV
ncbi:hypothetical protein B4U84_26010 [Westiellopsis prolifica IICB1]|nr:hypothetical protein B4U84_26010 [Westiellopsis prolifica IICB1]